jgi:hypothetical protein
MIVSSLSPGNLEEEPIMKTKYLHISAYPCDRCEGPVITAAFGIRESEITREGELTQVGAVCLSCGNKQSVMGQGNIARQFAPVEWTS